MSRVGRNSPCPCGSGKKYKNCCGGPAQLLFMDESIVNQLNFDINRLIAYRGKIGRMREDFCKKQRERKRLHLKKIEARQNAIVLARGATISCQKGCSYCCSVYTEATIQECELIVFHLYHNETSLSAFRESYPQWIEKVREAGDSFKKYEQLSLQLRATRLDIEGIQCLAQDLERIEHFSILCPFLRNDLCSIYKVRPYVCAGYFSTDPPQCCADYFGGKLPTLHKPFNADRTKIDAAVLRESVFDHSFYSRNLATPISLLMPLSVHHILEDGYGYLSHTTGLRELIAQIGNDPEVREVLESYNLARII